MEKKTVSELLLTLLFIGMLALTVDIRSAKASGTLYIGSDYTFTSNIYEPIVVTADNILIDGAGYTLQGSGSANGIDLSGRNNVTITNIEIKSFSIGITLHHSSTNTVSGNSITHNDRSGIYLFDYANNNGIAGNTITHNDHGLYLEYFANDNIIYHNNFVNNSDQVYTFESVSVWDDGHPSGGNYWSDYTGEDADSDGIGDTPYVIDEDNQDNYPLMKLWSSTAPAEVPFWMQWWFWAIVTAGIAVSLGAVYFLKQRKPPTPTAPPLPSEGADTPAQSI